MSPSLNLTIGSLFAGIGGLELGLERAGVGHTVWQVEKDEYCRAVLAKHWPDAQRFDDVRTVGAHNLAPVDVICGGFPCQDVSYAGRRAGIIDGTRSGLWYEFVRIIRELRPRYVIVENVTALLTLGLDVVLGQLAEGGYDAEWSCVRAVDVGAPHRRDRIFIVAHSDGDGLLQRVSAAGSGRGVVEADDCGSGWLGKGARPGSYGNSLPPESDRPGRWRTEPNVGRVAHGVPSRVDRLRALGNAVVPEVVGRVILALEAERVA